MSRPIPVALERGTCFAHRHGEDASGSRVAEPAERAHLELALGSAASLMADDRRDVGDAIAVSLRSLINSLSLMGLGSGASPVVTRRSTTDGDRAHVATVSPLLLMHNSGMQPSDSDVQVSRLFR